jgi:AraC-like DNA-binding protein
LSISRIAWLLGYQEVSAFTHAFKHWTGSTPREARAALTVPERDQSPMA